MKTSYPSFKHSLVTGLLAIFIIAVTGFFGTLEAQANCSLACTQMTQISLDGNCDTEVTYDMMLNAQMTSCPGGRFEVRVMIYKNGPILPSSPFVNKEHVNQTLTVEVMDMNSRNKCWGKILVEDKIPPAIYCQDDTLYCYEMRNYRGPLATDNCQKAAFLHSSAISDFEQFDGPAEYPWRGGPNYDDYTTSMDAVFGAGSWDDLEYETMDPEIVFSKAYCYIYMEGGDYDAIEMAEFLEINRTLIEQWVSEGGKLFINAAPNEGGNIDLGFGGVTILYNDPATLRTTGIAADPTHPVIQGASQPVGTEFTATYFGHVIVSPPGMNPILESVFGEGLLIETAYGNGFVLFGSLTPSGYHQPQPQARNLKLNILDYLKNVNGADVELTMLNESITPLVCNNDFVKRVTRTYIATDAQGNQSRPCTYDVFLRRFPLNEAEGPMDRSVAEENPLMCQDDFELDDNGNPHPNVTGVPTIYGQPLWPNQDFYCNIGVTYEDVDLQIRGCVRQIMRMWTIGEWWCSTNEEQHFTQIIEIVDDQGPIVTLPRDMTVTTSGRTCEAIVNLPAAEVFDSCSLNNVTVDVVYPGGFLQNRNGGQVKLPVGVNEITYTAYDACYNPTTATMEILVEDKTAPVAVCDQHTVVGITYDGFADVYAQTFDDGSYDDCWLDSMAVRRMDPNATVCDPGNEEFRPFVTFCCEDINGAVPPMIVLRVWDEFNNYNDCMVEVEVQDKLAPSISCPPNLTISCDYHLDREDLSDFGTVVTDKALQSHLAIAPPYLIDNDDLLYDGLAHDNCTFTIEEDTTFQINSCNVGMIERTFTAIDPNGQASCTQKIEIRNIDPFFINRMDPDDPFDDIIWPEDYETFESCDVGSLHPDSLPVEAGRPVITEDKCDLAEAIFEDETYPFAGDNACFKIIRTWKVIDWCQPLMRGGFQEWTYEQVIKVNNMEAPEIQSGCDASLADTFDPDCIDGFIELIATAIDDCTPGEELQWSYEIDAFSTGVFGPKTTGTGSTIDASDFYPIGDHMIRYSFEDRCGNKTTCTAPFSIINRKAPTVFCQNGLILPLMPIDTNGDGTPDDGMVEVWAEDFDAGSSHSCGYDLTFSFDPQGQELARTYNCDSFAQGPKFIVTIYVTDEVGNQASCVDTVILQDRQNACQNMVQSAIIGGRIATEDDEFVSEVAVDLQGAITNPFRTGNDGLYAFPPMPYGGSYTVVPGKNDDHLNGISTADLISIQKHLLGYEKLDSPYKLIAADANGSGDVTARDIIEIRRLILGINQEFTGSPSWRFIDKHYQFTDPSDPFSSGWSEVYDISGLNSHMSVDFTAVKIGDVNGSARANASQSLESRNIAEELVFEIEERSFEAGELVEVPVFMSDKIDWEGYQFTLNFNTDQLEWVEWRPGVVPVSPANFGEVYAQQGMVTTSWHGEVTDAREKLFTLIFRARQNGVLGDQLFISSDITRAEAYTPEGNIMDVDLQIRGRRGLGELTLYQNTPNPFSDQTVIRFAIPEPARATLTIYDVNGRVIEARVVDGVKGMNKVTVDAGNLSASGVLYYKLETLSSSVTKRMILLK